MSDLSQVVFWLVGGWFVIGASLSLLLSLPYAVVVALGSERDDQRSVERGDRAGRKRDGWIAWALAIGFASIGFMLLALLGVVASATDDVSTVGGPDGLAEALMVIGLPGAIGVLYWFVFRRVRVANFRRPSGQLVGAWIGSALGLAFVAGWVGGADYWSFIVGRGYDPRNSDLGQELAWIIAAFAPLLLLLFFGKVTRRNGALIVLGLVAGLALVGLTWFDSSVKLPSFDEPTPGSVLRQTTNSPVPGAGERIVFDIDDDASPFSARLDLVDPKGLLSGVRQNDPWQLRRFAIVGHYASADETPFPRWEGLALVVDSAVPIDD